MSDKLLYRCMRKFSPFITGIKASMPLIQYWSERLECWAHRRNHWSVILKVVCRIPVSYKSSLQDVGPCRASCFLLYIHTVVERLCPEELTVQLDKAAGERGDFPCSARMEPQWLSTTLKSHFLYGLSESQSHPRSQRLLLMLPRFSLVIT